MEVNAIPLHSWFWLAVPMSAVLLLSILNYFRHRNRASSAGHIHKRNETDGQSEHLSHKSGPGSKEMEDSEEEVPGKRRAPGKDLSSG